MLIRKIRPAKRLAKNKRQRLGVSPDFSELVQRFLNSFIGFDKMLTQMNKTIRIKANWIWEAENGFSYESVPGSIASNADLDTLRFTLKEINGNDDSFEVLITRSSNSFSAKIDYPGLQDRIFPLKAFVSENETVLYLESPQNLAYFHLEHV